MLPFIIAIAACVEQIYAMVEPHALSNTSTLIDTGFVKWRVPNYPVMTLHHCDRIQDDICVVDGHRRRWGRRGKYRNIHMGPTSDRFLTSGEESPHVYLWNPQVQSELPVASFQHTSGVLDVAATMDGALLFGFGADDQVIMWDGKALSPNATMKFEIQPGREVFGSAFLAVSTEGMKLVAAWERNTRCYVQVFDLQTRSLLPSVHFNRTFPPTAIALSRDGKFLFLATMVTLERWDLQVSPPVVDYDFEQQAVVSMALTPNTHWLVTNGMGGEILRWDVRSDKPQGVFIVGTEFNDNNADKVVITPDGDYVLGVAKRLVRMYSLHGASKERLVTTFDEIEASDLTVTPDGGFMIVSSEENVQVWELRLRIQSFWEQHDVGGRVRAVATLAPSVGHGNASVLIVTTGSMLQRWNTKLQLWDLFRSSEALWTSDIPHSGLGGDLTPYAVTPDGLWLLVAPSQILPVTLEVFRIDHWSVYENLVLHHRISLGQSSDDSVIHLGMGHHIIDQLCNDKILPPNDYAESCADGKGKGLCDVLPALAGEYCPKTCDLCLATQFGWTFFSGHATGEIRWWVPPLSATSVPRARNWIGTTPYPVLGAIMLATTPDKSHLFSATISTEMSEHVQMWDLQASSMTLNATLTQDGMRGRLTALEVSPDGKWLVAAAGPTGSVFRWSLGTAGGVLPRGFLCEHGAILWEMAVSPDSKWVATSGADAYVHLWPLDAESSAVATASFPLGGSGSATNHPLAWSPDGIFLMSSVSFLERVSVWAPWRIADYSDRLQASRLCTHHYCGACAIQSKAAAVNMLVPIPGWLDIIPMIWLIDLHDTQITQLSKHPPRAVSLVNFSGASFTLRSPYISPDWFTVPKLLDVRGTSGLEVFEVLELAARYPDYCEQAFEQYPFCLVRHTQLSNDTTRGTSCSDRFVSHGIAQRGSPLPALTTFITDPYALEFLCDCLPGYFGDGNKGCTICPADSYCLPAGKGPVQQNRDSFPCPPRSGTNLTEGNLDASSCKCYPGTYRNGSCEYCGRGTSSSEWETVACEQCEPGRFANRRGQVQCDPCSLGSYSKGNAVICDECRPGSFSPNATTECEPCEPGRFANQWGQRWCEACSPGSVATAGAVTCSECLPGTFAPNGTTCESCRPGKFADGRGQIVCKTCSPGSASTAGAVTCSECAAGTFALNGTTCDPCLPGEFADRRGKILCEPCSPGTHSTGGAVTCDECSANSYAASAGQSSCDSCRDAKEGATTCPFAWEYTVSNAASCLLMVGAFSVLFLSGLEVPISDIGVEDGHTVVTTTHPHSMRALTGSTFRVFCKGTGHDVLDKNKLLAKKWTTDKLMLLNREGRAFEFRVDTSVGAIHQKFPRSLLNTKSFRYAPIPDAFLVPVLLMIAFLIGMFSSTETHILLAELGITAVLCAGGAIVMRVGPVNHVYVSATPMRRRHRDYLKRLQAQGKIPQRCPRGAGRAIRAGQLVEFFTFFEPFMKDRTMYYVCASLIMPLTERVKLSFAELLGPTNVVWFVSHFWGSNFRQFVDAVQKHAHHPSIGDAGSGDGELQPESQSYWICSFSNNQWLVEEEVGATWQESSFYLALRGLTTRATVMILDELAMPLTRSWCLFEVLQTFKLEQESDNKFEGLLLSTNTGVLNYGAASKDVALALAGRLANLSVKDASASVQEDKDMIDALVLQEKDGFAGMDKFLRSRMGDALVAAKQHFDEEFDVMMGRLIDGDVVSMNSHPFIMSLLSPTSSPVHTLGTGKSGHITVPDTIGRPSTPSTGSNRGVYSPLGL